MKRTIRELRVARGLSQVELAQLAQVSTAQLCRIEKLEIGATEPVLKRLCKVLECRPEDVLTAEARKVGGQAKVARDELKSLVVPPERIARPSWTSASRLNVLRRTEPAFMRRVEPYLTRWPWFAEEAPSEELDETVFQLGELPHGAVPIWISTAAMGFDLWPVVDKDGRGAATRLRPGLITPDYVMTFQVQVIAGSRRPRMDALILVREPRPTFIDGEIDGETRDRKDDEDRERALGMVTLRIRAKELVNGPSLTERLRVMGYCRPKTR